MSEMLFVYLPTWTSLAQHQTSLTGKTWPIKYEKCYNKNKIPIEFQICWGSSWLNRSNHLSKLSPTSRCRYVNTFDTLDEPWSASNNGEKEESLCSAHCWLYCSKTPFKRGNLMEMWTNSRKNYLNFKYNWKLIQ